MFQQKTSNAVKHTHTYSNTGRLRCNSVLTHTAYSRLREINTVSRGAGVVNSVLKKQPMSGEEPRSLLVIISQKKN